MNIALLQSWIRVSCCKAHYRGCLLPLLIMVIIIFCCILMFLLLS